VTDSTLWLSHLQLLDSALPVGAFAHSFGLETLVQRGRVTTADDLYEYCRTILYGSLACGDALGVAAVYRYVPSGNLGELWRLDDAMHAARAAEETREGQRKIGRRLLQLGEAMHPGLNWLPLKSAVETGLCAGAHPLVYGWLCFHLEIPETAAIHGYLYGCLNSTVNNAVRLMRLGQTDGQKVLAKLIPEISKAWEQNRGNDPWDFTVSLPELEIAMMEHERLYSRLFMS
jgi:urease accessory protein